MNKFNVGIVGLGYVGSAIQYAYRALHEEVSSYDIDESKSPNCKTLSELTSKADLIYVSVPTPMKANGECDTSIVEQVVGDIAQSNTRKIIVIKSTVVPGTTERLQIRHPIHDIFFCPEFLTEANFMDDYLNQDVMLLGISRTSQRTLAESVLQEQLMISQVKYSSIVDATTAEFYKYVANIFLATKVSFANEMESVAKEMGINWDDITNIVGNDPRLGKSHWKVPGPDGHRGFGGTCVKPDTKILTTRGAVEIQNLSNHDRVMSTDELISTTDIKIIDAIVERDYTGTLYEFETDTGSLYCTPDHLIPIVRNGINLLIAAKDVRLTDFVYTYIKG